MSKRVSFRVQGEVQGVSFRYFTQEKATEYGLTGWVRNASGGDVQGEAQGNEGAIKKLMTGLNKGPSLATVEKVEQSDMETKSDESSFDVRK